jgi:hypothetical protein
MRNESNSNGFRKSFVTMRLSMPIGHKKPTGALTKDQAIDIFRLSLTHAPHKERPTAVSVARAFDVSEKTVRDIWSARTWHDETLPLDVNRIPREARKTGRPPGRCDSKPRKPRALKSSSSPPPSESTKNEEPIPDSTQTYPSNDSSRNQSDIFDLSCDDCPTDSSQPVQETVSIETKQAQQRSPSVMHGLQVTNTAPSSKRHSPFGSSGRAADCRYMPMQEELAFRSSPGAVPTHLTSPPSLRLPLHAPIPPSLHPIPGVRHPYPPPPSASSPPLALPAAHHQPLPVPTHILPRVSKQTAVSQQATATVPPSPHSGYIPGQVPSHMRPSPPAYAPVPGLLAVLLAMPPAAAAAILLAAAAAPRDSAGYR